MRQFSNRYIFLYSAALVAAAAVVLTVVSTSLKPLQQRNQQTETKQMILKTIGVEATRDNANQLYAQYITEEVLSDGSTHLAFDGGFIIPLQGTGLWGPIWGYLALDNEKTIVGAVFDHKGETPGLGGEIATDKFAQRFVGKSLIQPIVLKKNADKASPYEVDAISGGTMTSNGVTEMLAKAYHEYENVAAVSDAADENEERKEADE